MRRPELELRVAGGAEPDQIRVAARDDVERGHDLGVAAIEPFGEAQHRGQRPDRLPQAPLQGAIPIMGLFRRRLAMIARQERNNLDLLRVESPQLAVLNQVIRVPVVPFVGDMHAGVVEQRPVFQPLPLAVGERVDRPGLVEYGQRELRDVARVRGGIPAAFTQFDDAAAADVRVTLDLPDGRGVAVNVIEDQPLAQRQVAQRDVVGAEAAQHAVEQHRAGDRNIGAAWILR